MIITVEGAQTAGKSYLLEHSKFHSYHFEFTDYTKKFSYLSRIDPLLGFTMGKDLQLLQYAEKHPDELIIADRLFVSTLVFGSIFQRASLEILEEYAFLIAEHFHYVPIVYVQRDPHIQVDRNKNDGYDNIMKRRQQQIISYEFWLKKLPNTIYGFDNLFDDLSVDRFNYLIETILKYTFRSNK